MPIDPRDAPPGYRAAPSDGNCHCRDTKAPCAFWKLGTCLFPPGLRRPPVYAPDADSYRMATCYENIRPDGILAVFLKIVYGNEED